MKSVLLMEVIEMEKNVKIEILNHIKLLNAFARKHSDLEGELIKILGDSGLNASSEDFIGGFPDWFVEVVDYGMDMEPIDMNMVDRLIDDLSKIHKD